MRPGRVCVLLVLMTASAQAVQEPTAAPPSPAVQLALDDARAAAKAGNAAGALAAADRALDVAQRGRDVPGEAAAQRIRALQLTALQRSNDALAAWNAAEAAWKRIDDGPGQVEAIGWQAVAALVASPRDIEPLQRALALARAETARPRAAATSLVDIGRALVERSLFDPARHTFDAVLSISEKLGPESVEAAFGLNGLGSIALVRGDLAGAREYFERSLKMGERVSPDSLVVAASSGNLGVLAQRQGDLQAAVAYQTRSLTIRERLVPDSIEVAASLHNLGIVFRNLGDLTKARDYVERSLAIRERLAPNSLVLAASLQVLGNIALDSTGLTAAADYYRRSLTLYEKLAPDSIALASTLNNVGTLMMTLGHPGSAREYHERALAIREKLAPGSLDVAASYNNLGLVAQALGDLAAADHFARQALAIRERIAPDSLETAAGVNNLGSIALDRGQLDDARRLFERGLALYEKITPSSPLVAISLNNLAIVARRQGNVAVARTYYQRCLDIQEKLGPNSLQSADTLRNLSVLARLDGELGAARDLGMRALAIREKLQPESLDVAESLDDLAVLAFQQKDLPAALGYATRAWTIVRAQASAATGDEARQAFGTRYEAIGANLMEIQVALGKADEAFVTLEEGRAQSLLQLLAQRDFPRTLSPPDVWRRYETARAAADRAGSELEDAGEEEEGAKQALAAEIAQRSGPDVVAETRRVVAERERASEQARQAYTAARVEAEARWADVRRAIAPAVPAVADVAAARRALPDRAVLAAFSVGESASVLFFIRRDGPVDTFEIGIGSKELSARVDFVRRTASRERGERGLALPAADEIRVRAARELFQKLFPPAARAAMQRADRLILSPDGVLWDLPFAALVTNDSGAPEYLGLEKPLVYAQSLTTLTQAVNGRKGLRARQPAALVIGNPLFDNSLRDARVQRQGRADENAGTADTRGAGELLLLSRDGSIPAPLPYAEAEAERIASMYGTRAATGAEPTEAWFRQRAGDVDVVHLATHAYFNPFRAISSGLRLAVPPRAPGPGQTDNDGALQAWEVLTQLRLRADLVVLSACETGLGSKVPGEGLVGLTRAFQAAGHRERGGNPVAGPGQEHSGGHGRVPSAAAEWPR